MHDDHRLREGQTGDMGQHELVARAQRGDHEAFCAIARGALSRLFATAC